MLPKGWGMLSPQVATTTVEVPTRLVTDCNLSQVTATVRHLPQPMVPIESEHALLSHVKPFEATSDDAVPIVAMQGHTSSNPSPQAQHIAGNLSTNHQ